jgi:hypothetical protein
VGAIAAENEIEVNLEFLRSIGRLLVLVCLGTVRSLWWCLFSLKPGFPGVEVNSCQLVEEV